MDKTWMEVPGTRTHAGTVGLWWVDGRQFYIHSHGVDVGHDYGGNLHSVTNHAQTWRSVVLNHRSDLARFSYTYLPRGRVYYNQPEQKFVAVGTPTLLGIRGFLIALREKFEVGELHVSDQADEHYSGEMGPEMGNLIKTAGSWPDGLPELEKHNNRRS